MFAEAFFWAEGFSAHIERKIETHAKNLCQNCQNVSANLSFHPKGPLQA